jgi:ketosteroid isomerase-like protein
VSDPLEVVGEFHEAYRAADWETTMRLQAEHAVLVVRGGSEAGTYRGHDEIRGYFRRWLGTWTEYRFEILELIPRGDRVLIVGRESGRGKGSGAEVESLTTTMHEVRDGQIVHTESGAVTPAELAARRAEFSS